MRHCRGPSAGPLSQGDHASTARGDPATARLPAGQLSGRSVAAQLPFKRRTRPLPAMEVLSSGEPT